MNTVTSLFGKLFSHQTSPYLSKILAYRYVVQTILVKRISSYRKRGVSGVSEKVILKIMKGVLLCIIHNVVS